MNFIEKVFKYSLLVILILNVNISFAFSYVNIPNEINLNISWKALKEYIYYIESIKREFHINPIPKKYKKKFKAKIYFKNDENILQIYPAKVRITGDIKDHIDVHNNLSSFKVELVNGHIKNITKFRLLIDRKSYNDEIFWSILIRELGFPSNYMKNIKSSINGLPERHYFFQETYAKELIERVGFRNSPIIEMDDRELFHLERLKEKCYYVSYEGFKANSKCIKKIDNQLKKIDQYKIENKSFITNSLTAQIAYKGIVERNKLDIFLEIINNEHDYLISSHKKTFLNLKKKISILKNYKNFNQFNKISEMYAKHSLNNFNLKLLYEPMYNELIPVNWDSNVNLEDQCIKKNINYESKYKNNFLLNEIFDKIETEYFKVTNDVSLQSERKCLIELYFNDKNLVYEKHDKNLLLLDNNEKEILKEILINKTKNKLPIVILDSDFQGGKICDKFTCKELDFSQIKNTISGDFTYFDNEKNKIFPYLYLGTELKEKNYFSLSIPNNDKKFSISVNENETTYLKINKDNSLMELNIFLKDPKTSKVVIYDSDLFDLQINVKINNIDAKDKNNFQENRHDERLLTGCFTAINTTFFNTKINVQNAECEDALNLLRSSGFISEISINNSKFDALDVDNSKIKFKDIKIDSALNDCVDFSYGIYSIETLNVKNCHDKGISVGEKSEVIINNYFSKKTKMSFASKDSSILTLYEFKTDLNINNDCGELYKKKQEFNGGSLILNNEIQCRIKSDEFSKIYNNF